MQMFIVQLFCKNFSFCISTSDRSGAGVSQRDNAGHPHGPGQKHVPPQPHTGHHAAVQVGPGYKVHVPSQPHTGHHAAMQVYVQYMYTYL